MLPIESISSRKGPPAEVWTTSPIGESMPSLVPV